jgi:hypothetical protein
LKIEIKLARKEVYQQRKEWVFSFSFTLKGKTERDGRGRKRERYP